MCCSFIPRNISSMMWRRWLCQFPVSVVYTCSRAAVVNYLVLLYGPHAATASDSTKVTSCHDFCSSLQFNNCIPLYIQSISRLYNVGERSDLAVHVTKLRN